jgi:hypothetical protein
MYQSLGNKSLDDQDLPQATGSTSLIITPKPNHKENNITDIHAAKIDEETCVKGWFVPSMPDLNLTILWC